VYCTVWHTPDWRDTEVAETRLPRSVGDTQQLRGTVWCVLLYSQPASLLIFFFFFLTRAVLLYLLLLLLTRGESLFFCTSYCVLFLVVVLVIVVDEVFSFVYSVRPVPPFLSYREWILSFLFRRTACHHAYSRLAFSVYEKPLVVVVVDNHNNNHDDDDDDDDGSLVVVIFCSNFLLALQYSFSFLSSLLLFVSRGIGCCAVLCCAMLSTDRRLLNLFCAPVVLCCVVLCCPSS